MYKGLLHTHTLVVTLFLIHYVIKLLLLLTDKKDTLENYTKKTKIAEMVISVLFLVTGVGLLFSAAPKDNYLFLILKLVLVFISIPLAIVGFKKGNKGLALLSVVFIVGAYGLAEVNKGQAGKVTVDTSASEGDALAVGKTVYTSACANCHGSDGKLGMSGAKDLSATILTAEEQKQLIRNGKNSMPAFKELTDEQVDGVIQYVATLK
jgi:mono/diheme cytochrome c family protein